MADDSHFAAILAIRAEIANIEKQLASLTAQFASFVATQNKLEEVEGRNMASIMARLSEIEMRQSNWTFGSRVLAWVGGFVLGTIAMFAGMKDLLKEFFALKG